MNILFVSESHDDGQPLCIYSISPLHVKQHNHTSGNYVDANNTQHCSRSTDACFILWQEDPKNKSIIIFTQGIAFIIVFNIYLSTWRCNFDMILKFKN